VVRNELGSARVAYRVARDNAQRLIDAERALGIFHEPAIQRWFLEHRALLEACNVYYHAAHYVVPIAVLVFLRVRHRDRYRRAQVALFAAMALALVGFAVFPAAPPRLVAGHGFVDTVHAPRSTWDHPVREPTGSFKGYASNQFAAMPSVHCAWALWCACALVPRVRHRWAKVLAVLYPVCTVTAIVLTGNHYFLDAVGGFAVLGIGSLVARAFTRAGRSPVPQPLTT
jgi:membrane-associated phospholipid phosphatase